MKSNNKISNTRYLSMIDFQLALSFNFGFYWTSRFALGPIKTSVKTAGLENPYSAIKHNCYNMDIRMSRWHHCICILYCIVSYCIVLYSHAPFPSRVPCAVLQIVSEAMVSSGLNLDLTPIVTHCDVITAYEQGNTAVSRKQVLPVVKKFLENYKLTWLRSI